MNDKLERIWNDEVMFLSRYYLNGGTEESHRKPQSG
jgi:hypothetical protein